MSSPVTRSAIFLPTITSYSPGVKLRPSTTLIPLRTLKAIGRHPAEGDVGGWLPSVRFGRVVRTTTSHDAIGVPAAVARHARIDHHHVGVRDLHPRRQLRHRSALRDDAVQAAIRWTAARCGTPLPSPAGPRTPPPPARCQRPPAASPSSAAPDCARCTPMGSAIRFASMIPRCGSDIPSWPGRTPPASPSSRAMPMPSPVVCGDSPKLG